MARNILVVEDDHNISDLIHMTVWRNGEYLEVVLHLDEAFVEEPVG